MTIAVAVFPGTNCEHDIVHALELAGAEAELVWHRDVDLAGASGVVLGGRLPVDVGGLDGHRTVQKHIVGVELTVVGEL